MLEVRRRYPRLYIAPDFAKVVSTWVNTVPVEGFHTNQSLKIVCATRTLPPVNSAPSQPTVTKEPAPDGVFYSARVFVPTGNLVGRDHLAKELKFLVCKKGHSELLPIGGPWSSCLDGGDPGDPSSDALVRTAIRCTKEQVGLDLAHCSSWTRFLEIHYIRHHDRAPLEPTIEMSVIFLPDTDSIVPTLPEVCPLFIAIYAEVMELITFASVNGHVGESSTGANRTRHS